MEVPAAAGCAGLELLEKRSSKSIGCIRIDGELGAAAATGAATGAAAGAGDGARACREQNKLTIRKSDNSTTLQHSYFTRPSYCVIYYVSFTLHLLLRRLLRIIYYSCSYYIYQVSMPCATYHLLYI
jgi:hypothetical protein